MQDDDKAMLDLFLKAFDALNDIASQNSVAGEYKHSIRQCSKCGRIVHISHVIEEKRGRGPVKGVFKCECGHRNIVNLDEQP